MKKIKGATAKQPKGARSGLTKDQEKTNCGGIRTIHELAVTESVLKVALRYAEEHQAEKVVLINLQVGELRDLTEEWMQRYFDYLSRGTVAEGGKIILKKIPVKLKCAACEQLFSTDLRQDKISCPQCNSEKAELVSGNEFIIESIGVI